VQYKNVAMSPRNLDDLQQHFENVEHIAIVTSKYCMPHENNLPIFICRGPNFTFQKEWPNFKFFISGGT